MIFVVDWFPIRCLKTKLFLCPITRDASIQYNTIQYNTILYFHISLLQYIKRYCMASYIKVIKVFNG